MRDDRGFHLGAITPGGYAPQEFRRYAHGAVDWIANFLNGIDDLPIFPSIRPGVTGRALPSEPGAEPESMDALLDDFRSIIVPGMNHWNHPSFCGYFASSASGPGIIGELLVSAFNVNAMVLEAAPWFDCWQRADSIVPEYLRSSEQSESRRLMDYGI